MAEWTKEKLLRLRIPNGTIESYRDAVNALIEAVADLLPSVEEDEPKNG